MSKGRDMFFLHDSLDVGASTSTTVPLNDWKLVKVLTPNVAYRCEGFQPSRRVRLV